MWLVFLFSFVTAIQPVWSQTFPDPVLDLDPDRSFPGWDSDKRVMRRLMRETATRYVPLYQKEFMRLNRTSENRFPRDLMQRVYRQIDDVPDSQVLEFGLNGVSALKAYLDDVAAQAYGSKVSSASGGGGQNRVDTSQFQRELFSIKNSLDGLQSYSSQLSNEVADLRRKVEVLQSQMSSTRASPAPSALGSLATPSVQKRESGWLPLLLSLIALGLSGYQFFGQKRRR